MSSGVSEPPFGVRRYEVSPSRLRNAHDKVQNMNTDEYAGFKLSKDW